MTGNGGGTFYNASNVGPATRQRRRCAAHRRHGGTFGVITSERAGPRYAGMDGAIF